MTKRLKSLKLWPVFVAISAVIVLAGVILYALLGFNTSAEKPAYKTFEVQYNVVAVIQNKEDEIQDACEKAFKANGVSYTSKEAYKEVSGSAGIELDSKRLVYEFSSSVSGAALSRAGDAVKGLVLKNEAGEDIDVEMTVTVNTVKGETFYEAGWRAAVAIAVGAVVVLVYTGVRFGIASALSGLVGIVNAVFVTLGFFAIMRIPVFAVAPLLYASIAAITYMIFWLLHCMKMRDNFKDPEFGKYEAKEAVALSLLSSDKFVYWTAGGFALMIALLGVVTAATSMMLLVLPALVAVGCGLYSAALLSPSVHMYCKGTFDKLKKNKVRTYSSKKKSKVIKLEEDN